MAKATLPVNFKDDILNAGMDGKRKFTITQNTDGTYSIEDVTEYDQIGSNFGSAQINATNTAVNASADASKIIDDLATVAANTQKGYMAGALALKEVNQSLGNKVNTTDSRLSDARTPKAHTHDDRYYTESEINAKIMSLKNISSKTLTVPLVSITAGSWTQVSIKHGLNTSKIVSLTAFIDGDPKCGVTHCWIDGEYVKWNVSNYNAAEAAITKVTVGVDIRYLS